MPTFDFRCLACDERFEFTRPFGSDKKPACPACKSKRTEKQLSTPTIVFKGDGFYKTDSGKKPATPTETPAPAKEVKKAEKPAEAKPAKTDTEK